MNRLTDTEYKDLFTEIENAVNLDVARLNVLSEERFIRMCEANFDKRSDRSVMNRKFINLVQGLEKKHHCKLVGRNRKGDNVVVYEVREAGYSQWSGMNK